MVREYRMMTDEGETRICYRAINVKSVKSNCLMDQTFNLISKTGSLKLKLNNDLNRNSDARIIDTRTSRRLPLCTPLLFFQGSLKSSFART